MPRVSVPHVSLPRASVSGPLSPRRACDGSPRAHASFPACRALHFYMRLRVACMRYGQAPHREGGMRGRGRAARLVCGTTIRMCREIMYSRILRVMPRENVSSLLSGAGVQASPLRRSRRGGGVGEAQAASSRLATASPRSPKVRGAQSVLGTRPRYAVHPHRRRRTRTRCARAWRGQFRAGKRQTRLGANRLLVVAWGSAGRSLAQVSASFAVFCDGRRRLRVLSLLRLSAAATC